MQVHSVARRGGLRPFGERVRGVGAALAPQVVGAQLQRLLTGAVLRARLRLAYARWARRGVAVALLLAILVGLFFFLDSSPPGMAGKTTFVVARGATFDSIDSRLRSERLIRSTWFLHAAAVASGSARQLKAGTYLIDRGMTTLQIRSLLVSDNQLLERITIPEGWTLLQIADLLARKGVVARASFVEAAASPALLAKLGVPGKSAQGFLFPDTYSFPQHYPADLVVSTMVRTFFKNFDSLTSYRRRMAPQELLDTVILASIVEGEYRIPREAPEIASVFYNRLKRGMRLQSCATVAFVLTDILGEPHQTRLYDKDLLVKSPYNTYLHAGLPPEPISNPGTVALNAALHPAKTPYLYFVLKDPVTGAHFFSVSYAAHRMAKYEYLRLYLKSSQ